MNDNILIVIFTAISIATTTFLTYIGLSVELMYIYAGLLIADFISGVIKALVVGEELSYKKGRNGIITKMLLWFIPIVLACTTKIIGVEAQIIFQWGLGILAFTEGYSFMSNTYYIKKGKYLPEIDGIALLGSVLRKWLRSKLAKWEEDNDDK